MPAALPKGSLSEVVPAKEEQEHADTLYAEAGSEQRHSWSCGATSFLKPNADSVGSLAEGALKQKIIKHFLILQLRAKKGGKEVSGCQGDHRR